MGRKKVTTIINEDTGEVLHRRTSSSWSRWDDRGKYKFYHNRGSVESASDIPLPAGLDASDAGRMWMLSRYLVSDSGLLGIRSHRGVRPMTIRDISEQMGMKRSSVYALLRRLIDCGVVASVQVEVERKGEHHYYANPLYFAASDWIPLSLYLLFREQIDEHLPGWAIKQYKLADAEQGLDTT